MEVKQKFPGIFLVNEYLATVNLKTGNKVYGENLLDFKGEEFRLWDPRRSKLAAALLKGLINFNLEKDSKILYLGASAGTTPSHLSDIAYNGLVYCVEISPHMMKKLLNICRQRENMIPILEDASKPHNYLSLLQKVDLVYADVAQPHQTNIFIDNLRLYLKEDGYGIIMIKARSIDVTRKPKHVFREVKSKIIECGFRVVEKIDLEPYDKDHQAMVCKYAF
jgi:fibrillarin-like pre-rRNA processing protein